MNESDSIGFLALQQYTYACLGVLKIFALACSKIMSQIFNISCRYTASLYRGAADSNTSAQMLNQIDESDSKVVLERPKNVHALSQYSRFNASVFKIEPKISTFSYPYEPGPTRHSPQH